MKAHPAKPLIVSTAEAATVILSPDAETRKNEVLKLALAVTAVAGPQELELAVNRQREIKRLLDEVESTRKAVKAPVLTLGSRIDEIAKSFSLALNDEFKRIGGLVLNFQRAEQDRIDEENRRIQEETQRKERELADAQAEQDRLAALSKPQPKKEIAAATKVAEAQTALQQVQTTAPATVARAAGLSVKKEVFYEITDAAALYAVRPEFFKLEPRASVIKAVITKDTKLPGLKVWEDIKTGVRA